MTKTITDNKILSEQEKSKRHERNEAKKIEMEMVFDSVVAAFHFDRRCSGNDEGVSETEAFELHRQRVV